MIQPNDITTPAEHAATVRYGLEVGRAQLPNADWSEEFDALDTLLALAERATELEADLEAAGRWRPGATRRLAEAEARATELEAFPAALAAEIESREAAEARAEHLERERDEALNHCRGPMPSPERIAEAHSRLPREWFEKGTARLANHGVGHFAYYQGPEACYVCTLLGLYEAAEARAEQLETALRQIAQMPDSIHHDGHHARSIARAALDGGTE